MKEELNLRQMLELLWKRKIIILSVVLVFSMFAFIVSYFFIGKTYEAEAVLSYSQKIDKNVISTVLSYEEMNRMADQLKLDKKQNNPKEIPVQIKITPIEDAKTLRISLRGGDPKHTTDIVNYISMKIASKTQIMERLDTIVKAKEQMEKYENDIEVVTKKVNELTALLQANPQIVMTNNYLGSQKDMQMMMTERGTTNNSNIGKDNLISEQINPVNANLKTAEAEAKVELTALTEQKSVQQSIIAENEKLIAELENSISEKIMVETDKNHQMIGKTQVITMSPAIASDLPVSPNIKLNVALGFLFGLILAVIGVFVQYGWMESKRLDHKSNRTISM